MLYNGDAGNCFAPQLLRIGGLDMWHRNPYVTKALIAIVLLVMACLSLRASAQTTGEIECKVLYWVERPNMQGDPGNPVEDPEAKSDYILFDQEMRRAEADGTITLSAEEAGCYLRTNGQQRRFASFLSCGEPEVDADGMMTLNVYYVRDVFAYEFDLANEQSEMTVGGTTYTGIGDKFMLYGKYEQQVIVPGLDNGMLPANMNAALPDAYCAGWALDERTGIKEILSYTNSITEEMLPTDGMPYEDLIFELRAVWYGSSEQSILACWYEQLPEHEGLTDVNRMTYNGKIYVNFPATNYEISLPKGSKPEASSAPGLTFITRIDADSSKEGVEGRTWHFIYGRERYRVIFDTNGAGEIRAEDVMYQQNLSPFDPGWSEETTRTSGGTTYSFAGWYTGEGQFVANRLSEIYMPAKNLSLFAQWERVN